MDADGVQCLLCEAVNDAERCVAAVKLSNIRLSVSAICRHVVTDGQESCTVRPRFLPALKVTQPRRSRSSLITDSYGKANSRSSLVSPSEDVEAVLRLSHSTQCLPGSAGQTGYLPVHLPVPACLDDIDTTVLMSGAITCPGSRLSADDSVVVVVNCQQTDIWQINNYTHLYSLLLYCCLSPHSCCCCCCCSRPHSSQHNDVTVTLVVDARSSTVDTVNVLLTIVYNFKTLHPRRLHSVTVLVDDISKEYLFNSPAYQPKSVFRLNVASDEAQLHKYINKQFLPASLGGAVTVSHVQWLAFQQILDRLVRDCYSAATYLLTITDELTSNDSLPVSVHEAETLLSKHQQLSERVLEQPVIGRLMESGEAVLLQLREAVQQLDTNASIFHDSCQAADTLLRQVCDSCQRLSQVSTQRFNQLEQCLQLRQFEQRASNVINWLCTVAEDSITNYRTFCDNLQKAESQLEEFEKFRLTAQQYIDESSVIQDEAAMITQLGVSDQLTGIRDICRELKARTTTLYTQLNHTHSTLTDTCQCYRIIDKAYEWALETMKVVNTWKLDRSVSYTDLERSLRELDLITSKRLSPTNTETCQLMDELLHRVGNDRLNNLWFKAQGRCRETLNQLQLWQYALKAAISKMTCCNQLKSSSSCNVAAITKSAVAVAQGNMSTSVVTTDISTNTTSSTGSVHTMSNTATDGRSVCSGRSADMPVNIGTVCNSTLTNVNTDCTDTVDTLCDQQNCGNTQQNWESVDICPKHINSSNPSVGDQMDVTDGCQPQVTVSTCSSMSTGEMLISTGAVYDEPTCSAVTLCSEHSQIVTSDASQAQPDGMQPQQPATLMCRSQSFPTGITVLPRLDIRNYLIDRCVSPTTNDTLLTYSDDSLLSASSISLQPSSPSSSSPFALPASSDLLSKPCETATPMSAPAAGCHGNSNVAGKRGRHRWKLLRRAFDLFIDSERTISNVLTRSSERKSRQHLSAQSTSCESLESLPGLTDSEPLSPVDNTDKSLEGAVSCKYGWLPVPCSDTPVAATQCNNRRVLNTQSQSMTDLRSVTDDELRQSRILSLIMQELIQTERDYVQALNYVVNNYIPEILCDNIPQLLRGKKNVIFGNLEKICAFHSQIYLKKIEQCSNLPFQLGACFLDHEADLYLYALYNKNKPKSDELMKECGANYFKTKQQELNDRMDLNSYLLKPVQRMGKYALLLTQITKECPETHPDYSDLKAALEMVRFQLRHGNDLLAMDGLRSCDVNLQEQGLLLRQAEFIVFYGRKKSLRHVFLFEELVVFSKTRHSSSGHDAYIYKHSIKTTDIGLTESVSDAGDTFELWFRKRTPASTYILRAVTPHICADWVHDVSQLLWRQTLRNRERRLTELACLGVGDKLSVDLRPSKDNIHNRFVDISIANRGVRLRTSLRSNALRDHGVRNGNKRPHSLVSISSSSSSATSGSDRPSIGALWAGMGGAYSVGGVTDTGCGTGLFGTLSTMHESPLELVDSHGTVADGAANSRLMSLVASSQQQQQQVEARVSSVRQCNSPQDVNVPHQLTTSSNSQINFKHLTTMDCLLTSSGDCQGQDTSLNNSDSVGQDTSFMSDGGTIGKQDAYSQTTLKRSVKTVCTSDDDDSLDWNVSVADTNDY